MNILQLTPLVPYPPTDGGSIGIYNITKHVAERGHRITMLALSNRRVEDVSAMRAICELRVVHQNTAHSLRWAALALMNSKPYNVMKYQHKEFYRVLDDELSNKPYDIVHADLLAMAPYAVYAKRKYGIPIVLREHNLEAKFLQRYAENETNFAARLFLRAQAKKLKSYEPAICEEFDRCIMITKEDDEQLRKLSLRVITSIVPAGIDLPISISVGEEEENNILFLALLDWKPNVHGFLWFYKHVLPLIVREEPKVLVSIVGKGNAPALKDLRDPHLRFVGFVESINPWMQRAQVCVVPLFSGSGMRIKILEMFAHGKAVVSTSVGCEGIHARNGQEILIADTPEEFACCVLKVLREPILRRALGTAAREVVRNEYTWPKIAEQFEQVYSEVVRSKMPIPHIDEAKPA